MNFKRHAQPTGYVVLNFRHGPMTVVGGPFDAYQAGIGVCLEARSSKANLSQIPFPVPDFTAPSISKLEAKLVEIVEAHKKQPAQPVFVGCLGGKGRTGTVIAALVRLAAYDHWSSMEGDLAIEWTRANFHPDAVETDAQENLVMDFSPSRVVAELTHLHHIQTLEQVTEHVQAQEGNPP